MAVANGSPYYVAPALLREFEEELAPLMMLFSGGKDWVIRETPVSARFADQMAGFGFPTAEFVPKGEVKARLIERGIENVTVRPWGNSPAESNFFRFLHPIAKLDWHPAFKELYGRKAAAQFLADFIRKNPMPFFPQTDEMPQPITTIAEIELLLKRWETLVLKAPYSSSGRGLQVIRRQNLNRSNLQWIETTLKQQAYLMVEKWHEKICDLSFQFLLGENGQANNLGPSFFMTNPNGQYTGHHLHFSDFGQFPFSENDINKIGRMLCEELAKSAYADFYQGYIGIDALIYKERDMLKFHPCLEVNTRHTMGLVGKQIEKQLHPEAKGVFRTFFSQKESYAGFAEEMRHKHPPLIVDGKLANGFVSLTNPSLTSRFGAWLEIKAPDKN